MGMLCALIDMEVVHQTAAKGAFGEHALDGMANDALSTVFLLTELGGGVKALATRITRIACVKFLGFLFASEHHLVGIDDDHVVSTIGMRCEGWFVLPTKNLGHFGAESTYHQSGGIDDYPLFLDRILAHGNSLVT